MPEMKDSWNEVWRLRHEAGRYAVANDMLAASLLDTQASTMARRLEELRREATARAHAALDRGEHPTREDILECDTDALVRTQRACMEFRIPHPPACDCPWCRREPDPEAALRQNQESAFARTRSFVRVESGATGVKVSGLKEPVRIERMEVTGEGSVGIDLDE